jgi:hypothetical protein
MSIQERQATTPPLYGEQPNFTELLEQAVSDKTDFKKLAQAEQSEIVEKYAQLIFEDIKTRIADYIKAKKKLPEGSMTGMDCICTSYDLKHHLLSNLFTQALPNNSIYPRWKNMASMCGSNSIKDVDEYLKIINTLAHKTLLKMMEELKNSKGNERLEFTIRSEAFDDFFNTSRYCNNLQIRVYFPSPDDRPETLMAKAFRVGKETLEGLVLMAPGPE